MGVRMHNQRCSSRNYAESPGVQRAPLPLPGDEEANVQSEQQKLNTGPTPEATTSHQHRTVPPSSPKLRSERRQAHDTPTREPNPRDRKPHSPAQPPKMARKRNDPKEIKLSRPSRAEPTEKTLLQWAEERDLFAQAQRREQSAGAKATGSSKKARRWDAKTGEEVKEGESEEEEEEAVFTPGQERVFEAILWAFSISTVHFMLDVLVQNQYAIDIKWKSVVVRTGQAFLGKPHPHPHPPPLSPFRPHIQYPLTSNRTSLPPPPLPSPPAPLLPNLNPPPPRPLPAHLPPSPLPPRRHRRRLLPRPPHQHVRPPRRHEACADAGLPLGVGRRRDGPWAERLERCCCGGFLVFGGL